MYDLHKLGWSSFQQLCLTIAREVLGQTVQSFLDSHDGGRDGAFTGTWNPNGKESLSGAFVIQCKFTSQSAHLLRLSDLADEVAKAKRLVAKHLCDSYILITNAGLSGVRAEEIEARFIEVGVKHCKVLGSSWINQQILANKRLRMLVPRVYGLGDLSQILDERAYSQARSILDSMREDLAKVVVTDAYQKAADALDTHSFVLLIGEPAAGKTTIASLLAMAALDQWDASVLKLDDPGTVAERWNPDEPSQFFWIDDAFGVTQYENSLVRDWNRVLPRIKPMLRKGAKIVMTSRDYIYNQARRDLKESAFPLLKESQVVIDVHALSANEKRQILYNHLKLGKQPRSFRTEIKPYLESVADHARFIPETARRLADPMFTKDLFLDPYYLTQFFENREQLLQEVLQGLDAESKAALALIYMRNGALASPIDLQPSESEALQRLGSDLGGCIPALNALTDSLVLHTSAGGDSSWRFKHPTIGDAYASQLAQSPEHLGVYIQGTAPDRLINQVTCGDRGIERAVVVPRALFQMMLSKLEGITANGCHRSAWRSAFDARRMLLGFLATRCSKEFLALYLEKHPELLDDVAHPGLMLSAVPEVQLATRLHTFGLLPPEHRQAFIEMVSEYAVSGDDTDALGDSGIRSLFTDDEYESLVAAVRAELLPKLGDVRTRFQSNRDPDDSPEDYMQVFLSSLETLKKCFTGDSEATSIITQEMDRANEWIIDCALDESNREREPRALGRVTTPQLSNTVRSVFDDVDDDEAREDD